MAKSAQIIQFPTLESIPEPSIPLGNEARKLYDEICATYYRAGKLTELTLSEIEAVAICRDQIVKAQKSGKQVKVTLFTQWGLLMRPFRSTAEDDRPIAQPRENRFAHAGFAARRRAADG